MEGGGSEVVLRGEGGEGRWEGIMVREIIIKTIMQMKLNKQTGALVAHSGDKKVIPEFSVYSVSFILFFSLIRRFQSFLLPPPPPHPFVLRYNSR